MEYIRSKAKPKLGLPVKEAAVGKPIYLLNGKDMAALVPIHPTKDVTAALDVAAVNRRLSSSEQTPTSPWTHGDARRLVKQVLRRNPAR